MESGYKYFADHFSSLPAGGLSDAERFAADALAVSSNQAVFIYDFVANNMKYARGFGAFGFDDGSITIIDIFNTAIPEHREACGEISGKALFVAKTSDLASLEAGIVLNYAGRLNDGKDTHLMLESSVYETDEHGNTISTLVLITKLPHLPVPKLVRWYVFGDVAEEVADMVDDGLIQPNRISKRETEVLHQLSDGKTMSEVAETLCISARTVEQHVVNMRSRFECSNTGQLIAYGKDMGLV